MSEQQEIMNHYCALILMPTAEERRTALEKAPEQHREEVKRRVVDYFEMRAKRRVASENARLARIKREEAEKRRHEEAKKHRL